MNIRKNITINLSDDEVKQIIAKYLRKEEYNVTVKDVNFSVGTWLDGYGIIEHEVTYFDGCYIKCYRK